MRFLSEVFICLMMAVSLAFSQMEETQDSVVQNEIAVDSLLEDQSLEEQSQQVDTLAELNLQEVEENSADSVETLVQEETPQELPQEQPQELPQEQPLQSAVPMGVSRAAPNKNPQQSGACVVPKKVKICKTPSYIVDERDGQKYPYVQIGKQTWLAKNMNFRTVGSYCHSDDEAVCKKFGRLYTWASAMVLSKMANKERIYEKTNLKGWQGVCPSGWHIPSEDEWEELHDFVLNDRMLTSGKTRYSSVSRSWETPMTDSTDYFLRSKKGWYGAPGYNTYGFAAMGGGFRSETLYDGLLIDAYFWSSSEKKRIRGGSVEAYAINMTTDRIGFESVIMPKNYGLSVRCLKNSNK